MTDLLHSPIVRGALSGLTAAALVDFAAFSSWASVHDAMVYNWSLAMWRWFQGAVIGAVTAAGVGLA